MKNESETHMILGITSTNENCLRVALQTLPRDSPTRLQIWLNSNLFSDEKLKTKSLPAGWRG